MALGRKVQKKNETEREWRRVEEVGQEAWVTRQAANARAAVRCSCRRYQIRDRREDRGNRFSLGSKISPLPRYRSFVIILPPLPPIFTREYLSPQSVMLHECFKISGFLEVELNSIRLFI